MRLIRLYKDSPEPDKLTQIKDSPPVLGAHPTSLAWLGLESRRERRRNLGVDLVKQ